MKYPATILLFASVAGSLALPVQADSPSVLSGSGCKLRCTNAANPKDRYFEDNSIPFEKLEKTLLGDWNGLRRKMSDFGFTPTIGYTGAYFGNVTNSPREGSYGGGLSASFNWDFTKLGATGWSLYVGTWWMQASNTKALVNQAYFPANDDYVGNGFWLDQLYLQKKLLNGDLTLAAGRLGPGVTFATLPIFGAYSNAAINSNPGSLGLNEVPFAPPPPGVQWGAQALYNFTPELQGALGVFNNNPDSAAGKHHGTAWGWRSGNTGLLTMAQLNWLYNQGPKDTGMPGQYSVGGFWDGNRFPKIAASQSKDNTKVMSMEKDNWGLYLMGQQQITRPNGSGSSQGWTIWACGTYCDKQDINTMPVMIAGGASLTGPFKARPNDIVSVGWYWGSLSDRIEPPTQPTQCFEIFYQYTLNSAVNFVIDAQYYLRPLGYSEPGTLVLGMQFEVSI